MRRPQLTLALLASLPLGLASSTLASAASVGSQAPSMEPSKWLNNKGPVSWDSLKGRLILVERWATW